MEYKLIRILRFAGTLALFTKTSKLMKTESTPSAYLLDMVCKRMSNIVTNKRVCLKTKNSNGILIK